MDSRTFSRNWEHCYPLLSSLPRDQVQEKEKKCPMRGGCLQSIKLLCEREGALRESVTLGSGVVRKIGDLYYHLLKSNT